MKLKKWNFNLKNDLAYCHVKSLPKSLDLNPIEMIWNEMKKFVRKRNIQRVRNKKIKEVVVYKKENQAIIESRCKRGSSISSILFLLICLDEHKILDFNKSIKHFSCGHKRIFIFSTRNPKIINVMIKRIIRYSFI
ncbi:hypothetical protein BpHYR1_026015 [Brachionus plicatilis]|uniref:Tc1-like transposase DDE domain-containing protein n=1 Tax=Brachionus plicatilis TaxID=10195 RepID=A0A3M7RI43_BRAPC|nr:hypothetical protein BpHYR1_026015 [Brachionus plicatilis]